MKQKTKRVIFTKKTTALTAVLLAAVLFGFTACGEPGTGAYVMESAALLTSLTISGITVPGTERDEEDYRVPRVIPEPVDSTTWNSEVDLGGEEYTTITLRLPADMVNANISPAASRSARIHYGIGDQFNRPAFFVDYRVPATISSGDFLYIRVTSEDTLNTNYYRFYVRLYNSSTELADVFIADKRAQIADGGADWTLAQEGFLSITTINSKDRGKLRAIAQDPTSTLEFARLPKGSPATTAPAFRALATRIEVEGEKEIGKQTIKDEKGNDVEVPLMGPNEVTYFTMTDDFLDEDKFYVRVTAQNERDSAVYEFTVSVGRIATIKNLYMVNGANKSEVMGKGVPNTEWADTRQGSFATADQPTLGYDIDIVLDDPTGKYEYVMMASITANRPSAFTYNKDNSSKMVFDNINALAIKVTSENGLGIRYYKIKVELLAARFLIHPRSKAYYYYRSQEKADEYNEGTHDVKVDYASPPWVKSSTETLDVWDSDTPDELTFLLDRGGVDDYNYQWYEADSWYGGYGFDPNGLVWYNGPNGDLVEDGYDPNAGYEDTEYEEYAYHTNGLDEKKNVSLFNGGNQGNGHFVLPGRKVTRDFYGPNDGTSPTYRPPIDYKPFIPGFSYESHYYWVEVTRKDNGHKVTSGRASIISERNRNKQHYIIDTNNDYKSDETKVISGVTYKYPLPFKNVIPFTKQYDFFRIPLTFPQGFDIMNYSVMTAQAKFYLADGADWIQNWTNGNLAFEDNGKDPFPDQYTKEGNNVFVLYYNLTNNNATYMMASDSKEPAGAPLDRIPTHVVVSPSGDHTKGTNKDGYPPLTAAGRPTSAIAGTDLQGWFCGYVELVELRFESPARPKN
jgi:hypothetical protein